MRVRIADDHALTREALRQVLSRLPDLEVVGEAADGDEAVRAARRLQPDLVLMDIAMPRCDGLLATRLIKRALPNARVVILTVLDRPEEFWEAVRSGAQGYLVKSLDEDRLIEGLRHFARDDHPFGAELASGLIEALRGGPGRSGRDGPPGARAAYRALGSLTERERQIAVLVARGYTDREIAARLSIAEHTVKNHVKRCLAKTGCRNRTELARLVLEGAGPAASGGRLAAAEEA